MNNFKNHIEKEFLTILSEEEQMDYAICAIRENMSEYIDRYNLKSLVLGISGGIDSALVAALLAPVCEQKNIPLIGRSITIETNKEDEILRSILVGECFCHQFQYIDHTPLYTLFKKELLGNEDVDSSLFKLRQGNCKARMRMIFLYDLAQANKGIVLSTDNFTEYLTGFWTLHGDVGDYAPIIHLWKTEVYNIAQFLCRQLPEESKHVLKQCINALPTDGLGISDSDLVQLNVKSYQEVDTIFLNYFKQKEIVENQTIIDRYKHTEYKRKLPVFIDRKKLISKRLSEV